MKPTRLHRGYPACLLLLLVSLCVIVPWWTSHAAPTVEERLAKLEATQSTINSGDNAWLLTSSALVLMMTAPGLATSSAPLGSCWTGSRRRRICH